MQKWIEKLITHETASSKITPFSEQSSDGIDTIYLMVGKNLTPLISEENNSPLTQGLKVIQNQVVFETGMNIQDVQVKANLTLSENAYAIHSNNELLVEGHIHVGKYFFPHPKSVLEDLNIDGHACVNPVNGQEGVWISETNADILLEKGLNSINIIDYLAFHFLVVIKQKLLFKERCKQLQFSERECDVVKCVIAGSSNQEVAETLFITESTVKQHLQNIFEKANINSRYELIKLF